jgi:hypothetical protein
MGEMLRKSLDLTTWDCAKQSEGTVRSEDDKQRNRMKNRPPGALASITVVPVEMAGFLKKMREYDSRLQRGRRYELTDAKANWPCMKSRLCL